MRKRLFILGVMGENDGFLNAFLNASLEQSLSSEPTTLRKYFRNRLPFELYYRHPRSYVRNRPIPRDYPGHEGDSAQLSEHVRSLTTLERARIQTF